MLEKENHWDIKVIDFGLSRVFNKDKKMNQRLGTPYYVAPEVLKKKYDEKCDIWSIGIILHILLCGSPPFVGRNDDQIFEQITQGHLTFAAQEWKTVSNEAKIFIKKLLQPNPDTRYTARQALDDQWIRIYTGADIIQITQPICHKLRANVQNLFVRAYLKLQAFTFLG